MHVGSVGICRAATAKTKFTKVSSLLHFLYERAIDLIFEKFLWIEARDQEARRFCCGVALVSRIDKIIGLFCKRALQKRQYSAKETYNFIDPTDRSHAILFAERAATGQTYFSKVSSLPLLLSKRTVELIFEKFD